MTNVYGLEVVMTVERRVTKSVRMTPSGVAAIEEIQRRYGVDFSETVRRMLKVAYPQMPDKWPETRQF